MSPSVSIIIPCYNKQPYVGASIESALSQTHPCEVIVVDDGSTDESLAEIQRFNGKIRWFSGPNRGGCSARNAGIKMSSSEYLQFLDADDIMPQNKVSSQLAILSDAPINSVALSPWRFLHDQGRLDNAISRPYWRSYESGIHLLLDMWLSGGFFPTHAWLLPRALAQESGPWNEDLFADQDGEYFGRVLTMAGRIEFTSEVVVDYRIPPKGAVSRDKSRRAADSRMLAFEIVANRILAQRSDRAARRACLSRVRRTTYGLIEFEDILDKAAQWEKRLQIFDFSPSLPPIARGLVGILGVKDGLRALRQIKRNS